MAGTELQRACRACRRAIEKPEDMGWECECGVVVCPDSQCFEEYFRTVARGEGVRCLTCGLVT